MTDGILIADLARMHDDLVDQLLAGRTMPDVLDALNRLLSAFRQIFNGEYAPKYLVKLDTEVVPSHPRDVAVVRARMGTLVEVALAVIWNEAAQRGRGRNWSISMNYVTEYPNLYLRDDRCNVHLRLETKCLHDEADEGAARFDVLTPLIDPSKDVLIIIGWKWDSSGNRVYPWILAAEAFCAYELAVERDRRFRILGGRFRSGGKPYVRTRSGSFAPDPGNYGKLNRIVHASRRGAKLPPEIQRFQRLLQTLYPRTARNQGTR